MLSRLGCPNLPRPAHADPLRVLRAVRFAARFDFGLDSELTAAAALPEVRLPCWFSGLPDEYYGNLPNE